MTEALAERRAQKDQVLEAALQHAAFDGWSGRTLINAAADCGMDAPTARRLFPRGGDSLLEWLDDWTDRRMVAAVPDMNLASLPIRRRVVHLVRARLQALASHREAVRRAVVARGLPHNLGPGTRAIWRTVDLIWDLAGMPGGAGQGLSWYTRRGTLGAVLVATTLFWLEDTSENQADSWAFLDRRIEDVMRVGRVRAQVETLLRGVPGFRPAARRQ